MKKLLLMLALIVCTNVYAKDTYEFIGYTKDNTDASYYYEKVKLNKFYELKRINEVYEKADFVSEESPFMDKEDTIYEETNSKARMTGYENDLVVSLKCHNEFKVKTISFENLTSNVKRVEVYKGSKLLSTSFSDNTVELPSEENITEIRIKLYYSQMDAEMDAFTVTYVGSEETMNSEIKFDNNISDTNTMLIETLSEEYFNTFFPRYGFMVWKTAEKTDYFSHYRYYKVKYKFYNVEKSYYIMSELDKLEGYEYDASESLDYYKKYKILTIETDAEEIPKVETVSVAAPLQEVVPKVNIVSKKAPSKKLETIVKREYPAVADTSVDAASPKISKELIKSVEEEKNTRNAETTIDKNKKWIILAISILLILLIICYICVKLTK